MRLACIDIGTNSVKLVVADVEDRQIKKTVGGAAATTRIGEGVEKYHALLPWAMNRTLEAIEQFKKRAELLNADEIIAVATSAVRGALNRDLFVQKVLDRTGLKLLVLSGEEEARLTFVGTCSYPELRSKKLLILDVGGGSAEFVIGQNSDIEDAFSLNIGCVRMTEEFIHSDPITPAELKQIADHVTAQIQGCLDEISMDGRSMVGVGGTLRTLFGVRQYRGSGEEDYSIMLRDELNNMIAHLSQMKLEDRKSVPGMDPDRADIIVAGAVVFAATMEILDAKEMIFSDRGMRYGILLDK